MPVMDGVEAARRLTEFAEPENDNVPLGHWRDADLPPQLHAQLLQAVEAHSVTDLRRLVNAVDDLVDVSHSGALAHHLRGLADRYDMADVRLALLEIAASRQLTPEPGSSPA